MAVNLLRDAKVYLSTVDTGWSTANTWEIKVLDGFSFSQNTSTQEVTLNEAGAAPNRGQKIFNTALDPVDFSFSTYVRPYIKSGVATAGYQVVDFTGGLVASDDSGLAPLTAYDFNIDVDLAGVTPVTYTTGAGTIEVSDAITGINDALITAGFVGVRADLEAGNIKFVSASTGAASSVAITVGTTDLFAAFTAAPGTPLAAVAGSASATVHTAPEKILWDGITNGGAVDTPTSMDIDFDNSNQHELPKYFLYIDLGDVKFKLSEAIVASAEVDFSIDGIGMIAWTGQASTMASVATIPVGGEFTPVPATAGFLKNKLSTVTMTGGPANKTYVLGLTSASITIDNGVTFLTPEELGIVNTPIGHFTGTRAISGNMTCYLDSDANKSLTLLADMLSNVDTVTNSFSIVLNMGGIVVPFVSFEMPRAHIVVPQIDSQDVISTSIDFTALGTGLTTTDEMTVSYYAKPL